MHLGHAPRTPYPSDAFELCSVALHPGHEFEPRTPVHMPELNFLGDERPRYFDLDLRKMKLMRKGSSDSRSSLNTRRACSGRSRADSGIVP